MSPTSQKHGEELSKRGRRSIAKRRLPLLRRHGHRDPDGAAMGRRRAAGGGAENRAR